MAQILERIEGHHDIALRLVQDLKDNTLPSCLLFTGPLGIGKRLVAKALAQAANCEQHVTTACGECGSCLRIDQESSPESIFELRAQNGNQIKIDEAREALRFFELQSISRSRFLIIDDAELLNLQAANSLLKTLEEPPHDSYVILVTAFPWKLLSTIRSRAVKIQFRALSTSSLRKIVPQAPLWILNASHGQVGRIQELVSWNSAGYRDTAEQLLRALTSDDPQVIDDKFRSSMSNREQGLMIIRFMESFIRDFIWWKQSRFADGIINIDKLSWIKEFCDVYSQDLDHLFDLAQKLELQLRKNCDGILSLDSFLIEATYAPD